MFVHFYSYVDVGVALELSHIGTSSAGRYSTPSIRRSLLSGSWALSRLVSRPGWLPKTFLKVKSALGARYLACACKVWCFFL